MLKLSLTQFLCAALWLLTVAGASPLLPRATNNQNLMDKLITSVTEVQRVKALVMDNPKNFVFDFAANKTNTGAGPCGMNTAHTHPRGSEFVVVVAGTLLSGFILENGLTDQVSTTLPQYSLTVYPQGSIHYQFNPGCEEAIFVAGFNHEDPGTSQVVQNIFALNPDILNATLGFPTSIDGKDIEKFKALIPKSVALGVDDCLKKCNLTAATT
ncbi:hypothetical protein FBEOM_10967 [Fusarium beomiforme]|uniref:Cupin type-1 domain-containing protein n=1 Tax=Fusarium beomiforme TaxID=44412 RepID=A0A9P5AC12_9HYPO|nr:hypothetical protein FBEOM_10967 [Fusarium beomiforme]